ncbi:MAG: protein-L-isoaspartate(D-aspartate) O-methyltransferase, partial [Capnocytophaga sp.]
RHLFLDSIFEEKAYQDIAFPIGADQTISRPHTVAFQTELLQVRQGQKVLEIGTGSGYQSAVLVFLKVDLYTIERQQELFKKTKLLLEKMGYIPKKMIFGDGYKGYVEQAPYDRILVTAGAPEVPMELLAQLKIGGRLVIPIGKGEQIMTVFTRLSPNEFNKEEYGTFGFVPMLENVQAKIR